MYTNNRVIRRFTKYMNMQGKRPFTLLFNNCNFDLYNLQMVEEDHGQN